MVKNIKEIHPKSLLLFKVGAFCEAYGKDSYIISYLFDYQVRQKDVNDNIRMYKKSNLKMYKNVHS